MKTNFNDIDELLVKYLTGESTEEERGYVQQWIRQNDENRRYYDHFRLIWEESLHLSATTQVDEQGAWERFQQRTRQQPARVRRFPILRIAAILIVAVGLGWIAWSLLSDKTANDIPLAILRSTNEVKTDTLPDGSVITINKNSSLSFPQQFKGKMRKVQLTGEGFFAVTPDKEKPFVVYAGNNVIVEVLGTSFNIKSREDSTEVIVETGHVQVSWQLRKISLQPGEKLVIKNNGDSVRKQLVSDHLYNYYRSRIFQCDNTPLWKLVEVLNEAYNANIVFGRPELRTMTITSTFNNQSLDSVLSIVQETMGIKAVKENGAIILQ